MKRLLPALLLLLCATPARAILNETGNGNTSAPLGSPTEPEDPGWNNVGRIGGNVVYLGYGWMITANHVPMGTQVQLDGVWYPSIAASQRVIQHDASHDADLQVFRLDPYPKQLPVLPIAERSSPSVPPAIGTPVIMIGKGREIDVAQSCGPGCFVWSSYGGPKRWGTNHIGGDLDDPPVIPAPPNPVSSIAWPYLNLITQVLVTQFDQGGSGWEGVAVTGDSGGALFLDVGGSWELAGIQWANTSDVGQQPETSVYDNDTLSADLTYYRQQILDIVRPCDDGVDNDSDGDIDLLDSGCLWEGDMSELPACADGIDNDWDGSIDLVDGDCSSSGDLLEEADADDDLVPDDDDNCLDTENWSQLDTNLDGFGNQCDPDFNDDGVVGVPDFFTWRNAFQAGAPYDPDIDTTGEGVTGIPDYFTWRQYFRGSGTPGPSGLACAGTIPCQ